MKIAMWIVGTLAAFVASTVNAEGICYDHNRPDKAGDLQMIKERGFSHVRTYVSTNGVADIVIKSGLRSMLGVPVDGNHMASKADEDAAVAAAASPARTVDYIMVGNENLENMGAAPGNFIAEILRIKERVRAYGVRVGTVQRYTEVMHLSNLGELVAACDAFGVNIHPFFSPEVPRIGAIGVANSQWQKSVERVGGKLILTETGWPSTGSYGANTGSVAAENAYWAGYKGTTMYNALAHSDKYYFQAFDTSYKHVEYEKTFGLFNEGRGDKVAGAGAAPAPAPTPEPTTPEPTTPAPTTLEPASNATSSSGENEEGVSSGSASLGDAGEVGGEATTDVDLGIATNEDATTDLTPAPEDGTETGDNAPEDDATEANTQSTGGSSTAGLIVVILMGCAAVGGAFAFIYKARMKAAEVERGESKSFDMTVTPGGACVL